MSRLVSLAGRSTLSLADFTSVGYCHCRLDKEPASYQGLQCEPLCRAEGADKAVDLNLHSIFPSTSACSVLYVPPRSRIDVSFPRAVPLSVDPLFDAAFIPYAFLR
jgi:hypothetical protein